MKILLVNDYAIPQGGAEILLLNLRTALRNRGHDVRLFASDAGAGKSESLADYRCFGTISRFRTLLQTANPSAATRIRRVLAEFRPDVVHVKMFLSQLSPLILPALRPFPTVYHVVWYRPICPIGTKMLPDRTVCYSPPGLICHRSGCLPWHNWLLLMLQLKLFQQWRDVFDVVVAPSDHVRARLLAEGIAPVELALNGVAPCQLRSSFSNTPKIAFAGRLVREKGTDVLLRAFAIVRHRVPEARLEICGEGPERNSLAKLAENLQLNDTVSFLGFQTNQQVQQVFRDAWVVAIPSIWEEPFGHVAIEAMMNGVALIASDVGGLREIVRDGESGFLCAPGDVQSLALALIKTLTDRELALRLGRLAHRRAMEKFNEQQLVDRFLQIYGSICRRDRYETNRVASQSL